MTDQQQYIDSWMGMLVLFWSVEHIICMPLVKYIEITIDSYFV